LASLHSPRSRELSILCSTTNYQSSEQMASVKKRIPKPDLSKYDSSPLYLYTEKDSLNRVTVLKETAKDIYLIAGRYSGVEGDARLYTPLTDEEKGEIERNLRGSHKDALINHL
jgi:hypothetical protein